MGKRYTWSIKEIDKIIEELDERTSHGSYYDDETPALYFSINTYTQIKSFIEYFEKEKNGECESDKEETTNEEELKEFYKWMSYQRKDFKYLFSDEIVELISYFATYEIPKRDLLTPLNISEQEVVDSVKKGLNSFNKNVCNNWIKLLKQHPHMIQFCNLVDDEDLAYGKCFYDPYNNIPYILSGKANNASDFEAVNHESGHALYNASHYFNSNRNMEIYMNEVPAYFIQMLGMGNLPSKFNSQIELLGKDQIGRIISFSKLLVQQLDLYKSILQGKSYRKGTIHYDLNSEEESLVRRSNNNTYVFNIMYIYSYLIAKHMKNEYDNSPSTISRIVSPLYIPSNSRTISHVYSQMGMNEDTLRDVFESEAKKYGAKRAN